MQRGGALGLEPRRGSVLGGLSGILGLRLGLPGTPGDGGSEPWQRAQDGEGSGSLVWGFGSGVLPQAQATE